VPIAAVLGFFLFGPRGLITPRIVGFTLVFLVGWAIFTNVRGAIIDWYPYGFVDVSAKGYPRVLLNSLGLAIGYVGVGFLCLAVDRGIAGRLHGPVRDQSMSSQIGQ
jgi:apolipoprotein N-acyltransferase